MVAIRILHIIPNFGTGGAERMAVNLICGLAKSGFDVGAVSLFNRVGTDLEAVLDNAGVPVWYLGKRLGFDPRMYIRLNRVLRSFRPEVVHTHRYVLRYVWPLLEYHRVKVKVHTVHNVAEKEVDRFGRWLHLVAFHTGVVPVSIAHAVSVSLRRVYGLLDVPLIPNGIPVEQYASPKVPRADWRRKEGLCDQGVIFVSIGRLAAQKNPSLLVKAFAEGPAAIDSDAQLLFVGEGPLRTELEEQVHAIGLTHRVRFLGLRTDIPDVLAAADVFVSSSDYEGNPLAIMEAMAAGKPIIATAVGGVPELVEHGKNGLLVSSGNVEAMAEAMVGLLRNGSMRVRMGRHGAAKATRLFNVANMVAAYECLYQQLWNKETYPVRLEKG